jgi:FMN phosphatase YigB (HAD superfamily)
MPAVKRAVLIDALGTMLWMRPPWEEVDPALVAGIEPDRVRQAFMAEISYYLEHIEEGSDEQRLADLRRRCALVLSEGLGIPVTVEQMLAAIRFEAFGEADAALRGLRARGLRVVCVSNWDCSLPQVLERLDLARHLDGVVSSASSGARKPDPAIFDAGLKLAGCAAEEALHVGDSDEDVEGARAAGIEVLRIDRSLAGGRQPAGTITSLTEIGQHLGGARPGASENR